MSFLIIELILNQCISFKVAFCREKMWLSYNLWLWIYENHLVNCGLRNEDKSSSQNKVRKNSVMYRIWLHELCHTGAVLYQFPQLLKWCSLLQRLLFIFISLNWWTKYVIFRKFCKVFFVAHMHFSIRTSCCW